MTGWALGGPALALTGRRQVPVVAEHPDRQRLSSAIGTHEVYLVGAWPTSRLSRYLTPAASVGSAHTTGPIAGEHVFVRSVAVVISRPRDEVFAFVADARNRPRWDDSVDSEELTSPEPIGVGTTVRTRLRSMGRDYEYTWEVVEHQPPSQMTIESTSGPMSITLAYRLDAVDGGTSVQFSVTGRPAGLLRPLQPLIARTTQGNLDRGFARLKALLETGAASGTTA
jgi:carbon monoxide dehydrogenase subunit G